MGGELALLCVCVCVYIQIYKQTHIYTHLYSYSHKQEKIEREHAREELALLRKTQDAVQTQMADAEKRKAGQSKVQT